jgi:hypothetical protein
MSRKNSSPHANASNIDMSPGYAGHLTVCLA